MKIVLIVDDEIAISDLLKDILEEEGHTVELAGDGQQALEIIQQQRPSLVISDVMMPRMDGLALCRKIKADPKTAQIPVILMTAAQVQDVASVGASALIYKPFDIDQLLAIVEQTLQDVKLA